MKSNHLGVYYTLFSSYYESDKSANSISVNVIVFRIDIVWRLSGFAFFVRLTSVAAFFIFEMFLQAPFCLWRLTKEFFENTCQYLKVQS